MLDPVMIIHHVLECLYQYQFSAGHCGRSLAPQTAQGRSLSFHPLPNKRSREWERVACESWKKEDRRERRGKKRTTPTPFPLGHYTLSQFLFDHSNRSLFTGYRTICDSYSRP